MNVGVRRVCDAFVPEVSFTLLRMLGGEDHFGKPMVYGEKPIQNICLQHLRCPLGKVMP